ncbi:Phage-related lysozyme (muramidase), GH24 family [Acetitomaculum ruminis DSM 5522]|uniref:Lysozyme n=1 Tax=Acetitomaculum ruminis DSM 5522 TaxID=1120918 RepID=A0A1I0WEL8_9FIRM|nr:glycoside hydrolase family protein [Acetitomaculum ruminis]SFA87195.1 Phage-related lysozyme (muramidase), GH24 family [Acetitomaculum ruminis DSM 5522]
MRTNTAGINLIKSFEGCTLTAYKLAGEQYYTIGYGHSFDKSITAGTRWTEKQAENALIADLVKFENYVTNIALVKFPNLNSNQFSALVSYCYNRGAGGLRQLITNSYNINSLSQNIVKFWGSATRYRTGLVRRRTAEQKLFNTPCESSSSAGAAGFKPKGTLIAIEKCDLYKDLGAHKVGELGAGNRVEFETYINKYVKIKHPQIGVCYAPATYLDKKNWKAAATKTVNCQKLNIRLNPSNTALILGKLNKGNRVEINKETENGFYKCKVKGYGIVWLSASYLD